MTTARFPRLRMRAFCPWLLLPALMSAPLAWSQGREPAEAAAPPVPALQASQTTGQTPPKPRANASPSPVDLPDLVLNVGDTHVIAAPNVGRIAVGNGRVISAAALDDREVLVFANAPGVSSLFIWHRDGRYQRVKVIARSADSRRVQDELQALLNRIPGLRATPVGDQIILEGDGLSDLDQQRLVGLMKRYPQLVDFTHPLGVERMVRLDVRVLELPRNFLRELGVRWNPSSEGGIAAGAAWDPAVRGALTDRPGEQAISVPFPSAGLSAWLGLNALFSARLNAMIQSGEAVVLAEPQLSARNGATARFLAGGEVPYTVTDKNGGSNTQFKPYGVTLITQPRVDAAGRIRASVDIEVSAVDTNLTGAAGPALKVRRTSTEFQAHTGQTLVLGGFLSREQSEDIDRVPGLSSIPILGVLFKSKRFQRRETEMAILVTPRVLSADGREDARALQTAAEAVKLLSAPRGIVPQPEAGDGWQP